jgi:cbb3-type cytochrome oxidase subunit 3
MIQDVITRAANSVWPLISLLIFVLCFVGVMIWTYSGRKDRFREQAALPLNDHLSSENEMGANDGQ